MTVKELKTKLEAFDENLIVVACDYEDDSNESGLTLIHLDGAEVLESNNGEKRLILHTYVPKIVVDDERFNYEDHD